MENQTSKIIFVHFYNSISGSPKVLSSVIESITNKEIILVTNRTEGFLSGLQIPTIKFRFNISKSKLITLYSYLCAQISLFFIILKICKRGDLLYINTTIPMFASFSGKMKGAKIIFHLHEDRQSLNFIHRFFSRFRKFFCDVEIFVSKYLQMREHISGKKDFVVHNVTPLSFYEEAIKYKIDHRRDGIFRVLMVCSLKAYKGVYEFMALARLFTSYEDVKFDLVVAENAIDIVNFFGDFDIPINVEIHEKTQNTISFYKNSSILVNLSRPDQWIETYGLTILEGMTVGLPCIVPPIGGPVELIEENVNGYLVSSYDLDSLFIAVLGLYNNKSKFLLMSDNNKMKAKEFDYSSFAAKINQIITEVDKL